MHQIYPNNFEHKIGFDRIRELVGIKCISDLGKKQIEKIRFLNDPDMIRQLLRETFEFLCINRQETFPLGHFTDISESLEKIKVEGTHFTVEEVHEIRKSLDTVKGILTFFRGKKKELYPNLARICERVKFYPFVTDRIDKILTKNGKMKDNASRELVQIRQEISRKHTSVVKVLDNILKALRTEGFVDKDAEISIRNGRPVIPVNASDKRKIKGIIHDESATGKTSFIEPANVVELNNEIKELEYAERREIIRILVLLTNDLRPYREDLLLSNDFLGNIDFIRAKALHAEMIGGDLPELSENQIISWKDAVHPLLLLSHRKENKEVVPLTIDLNQQQRILLISGPNAGGKSVCLKTVGLLQYMLQCGLLVPMDETSQAGIFNKIFIDIGDEQSIENDLSTYSSHLMNLKYFIRHAGPSTLLLIDEFGTGTEPVLGGAIAEAVLDNLNNKQVYGIITTHYSNLKHFASTAEGIVNGAMLFDMQRMQPLFKLEAGQPGSSYAIEIARNIGLPEDVIKDASGRMGEDQLQFDRHLREIIRDKRYWEMKRDNIRKAEKKLQQVLEKYTQELELTETTTKEIIDKAKEEAEEILSQANKKIEKTIREIKEAQAEKERTRKAREELGTIQKNIGTERSSREDQLHQRIIMIREETAKVRERRRRFGQLEPSRRPAKKITDPTIRPGDFVFLKGQDQPGEVIGRKGNSVVVNFGQVSTRVDVSKLEKTTKLYFKPEIDVRGKRAEEAIQAVVELIDEAIVVETDVVRILHGKGDGILRQVIREYLKTVDIVESFHDEHIQLGGAGITIVKISAGD
ncbi:MAG: methionine ABC transporter substrate-binding protein [Bacteroides sp. SM23_62_1]|nr:MAG: methionine ABC transporter substrate-binding protein [Bacteroides sp. SM23_62_1]